MLNVITLRSLCGFEPLIGLLLFLQIDLNLIKKEKSMTSGQHLSKAPSLLNQYTLLKSTLSYDFNISDMLTNYLYNPNKKLLKIKQSISRSPILKG